MTEYLHGVMTLAEVFSVLGEYLCGWNAKDIDNKTFVWQ